MIIKNFNNILQLYFIIIKLKLKYNKFIKLIIKAILLNNKNIYKKTIIKNNS